MSEPIGDFTATGLMVDHGIVEPCTVVRTDGRIEIDRGGSDRYDFKAIIVKDMVNAHTHCGDYGLKIPLGLSLEELVAPPNGLKHRYLSEISSKDLMDSMSRFCKVSDTTGSVSFIDFREGGVDGARLLRYCKNDAIILGRPTSAEFDPEEVQELLSVADGIGIPSISDMPFGYIESLADAARDAGKIFAIHASERVREDIDQILSLDPAFVVHMCEATDDDMAKCAEAEVPAVVCPTSNAYFGKITPIVRMIGNGMDVALGTDNGMLCEPDLVKEAGVLSAIIEAERGNPDDAWKTLSSFAGKLLYRTKTMKEQVPNSQISVIPQQDTLKGEFSDVSTFRIKMNRGVIRNGIQQDPGPNRRE